MNETVEQLIISRDAQDRCTNWVDNIKDDAVLIDDSNNKRKVDSESDDYMETDSEFSSVSTCGAKRRKLAVQLKKEKFNLVCEWKTCTFVNKSVDTFARHVANHVTELDIKITPEDEVFVCLWSGCTFECSFSVEITRHVNYHAYHSKLKSLGMNVRQRTKLPVSIFILVYKKVILLITNKCKLLILYRNVNVTKIGKIFWNHYLHMNVYGIIVIKTLIITSSIFTIF